MTRPVEISLAIAATAEKWRDDAATLRRRGCEREAALLEQLADEACTVACCPRQIAPTLAAATPATTWREKLWTVPTETRLGLVELCEALGRPKSWVYRRTSAKSGLPLVPHRKLDGALTFVAGEIRAWLATEEEIIHALRPPPRPPLHARRAS